MSSSGAVVDPALRDRDGLVSLSVVARDGEVGGPNALQAERTSDTKDNRPHIPQPSEVQRATTQKGGYDNTFPAADASLRTENRLNGRPGTLSWNHSASSLVETSNTASSEHATVNGGRTR